MPTCLVIHEGECPKETSSRTIPDMRLMSCDPLALLWRMVDTYTDSFLRSGGELPTEVHLVNTDISIEHLRYTYYLIYKEDCSKSIGRRCFIDFLQTIFSRFAHTEKSTTEKFFSKAPKSYNQDIESRLKEK